MSCGHEILTREARYSRGSWGECYVHSNRALLQNFLLHSLRYDSLQSDPRVITGQETILGIHAARERLFWPQFLTSFISYVEGESLPTDSGTSHRPVRIELESRAVFIAANMLLYSSLYPPTPDLLEAHNP